MDSDYVWSLTLSTLYEHRIIVLQIMDLRSMKNENVVDLGIFNFLTLIVPSCNVEVTWYIIKLYIFIYFMYIYLRNLLEIDGLRCSARGVRFLFRNMTLWNNHT